MSDNVVIIRHQTITPAESDARSRQPARQNVRCPRPDRPARPCRRVRHSQSAGRDPRDDASSAVSDNTRRAYDADWPQYARWCRRRGAAPLPPTRELVGLYLAELAAPVGRASGLTVASIERRLSGLAWAARQRGCTFDRQDRHIATVLAGIRRLHARPSVRKEAILAEDMLAMAPPYPSTSAAGGTAQCF